MSSTLLNIMLYYISLGNILFIHVIFPAQKPSVDPLFFLSSKCTLFTLAFKGLPHVNPIFMSSFISHNLPIFVAQPYH